MDNCDLRQIIYAQEKIVMKRIDENRDRITISWHRYEECGANKELCRKINDLYTLLIEQGCETAKDINDCILKNLTLTYNYSSETVDYAIPFRMGIEHSIYELEYYCKKIIFPLKESSNETVCNLVRSIENDLKKVQKRCKTYIFDEPFSLLFNPGDYYDICMDVPKIAAQAHCLDCYTASYFTIVFTENEDFCKMLVDSALNNVIHFFKPYNSSTAMDAYHLAKQLPRNFIRVLFCSYEQDTLRYSHLLSSLEYGDEREFVNLFHDSNFLLFREHYYFLYVALAYYKLYTQQSNVLPDMREYISTEYDYPYYSYSQEIRSIIADYLEKREGIDSNLIPEMSRVLSFNSFNKLDVDQEQSVEEDINQELKKQQVKKKDIVCFVAHAEINKRYDVTKLVEYLTTTNEFTDIIFVERGDKDEYDVKDCLKYFFYPYDETIRRKIQEKKFSPDFQLEWKGRHAVSLRCLVRLLLNANTEKWAEAEDVFDPAMDDRLSQEYVSLQDNKSPIWKPVTKVFSKNAIYNARIEKKASDKTIKANEKEIKEIINIVFACKK